MKHIATGFLAALFLTVSTSALANGYHGGHRHHGHWHNRTHVHHHHGHMHWVAPLIIGGVVGAAIAANRVEAQTQAPVVVVPGQPATIVQDAQNNAVIQCPQGTMPFEYQGWVKNQFGQFVQTNFIRCQ